MISVLEACYILPLQKQERSGNSEPTWRHGEKNGAASLRAAPSTFLSWDFESKGLICHKIVHVISGWVSSLQVLHTRAMYSNHTGNNPALLAEVLNEWDLKEKEPVIIIDNATNMAHAFTWSFCTLSVLPTYWTLITLTNDDKTVAQNVVKTLKPMYTATLCLKKVPTLSHCTFCRVSY